MKRVLIATGPGFQDEEVIYPWYRFMEDYSVDVVTSNDDVSIGKYGTKIKPTLVQSELSQFKFDCIFVPGGHEAPDRVRQCRPILESIASNYREGALLSTICHGPWVLISSGVVKGKRLTGYIAIKDDINNAGGTYVEQDLVEDSNIISSPHYNQNSLLLKRTCQLLQA